MKSEQQLDSIEHRQDGDATAITAQYAPNVTSETQQRLRIHIAPLRQQHVREQRLQLVN